MQYIINTLRHPRKNLLLLFIITLASAIALYSYCSGSLLAKWPISYKLLGASFLWGQTYLPVFPGSDLATLPNPYDPELHPYVNYLLDASLYGRHYYLPFGPVPALMPWIPVKWLTGVGLNDRQLSFYFSLTGTGCLVFLLTMFALRQRTIPKWGLWFSVMALCFGTWIPQLLHEPGIYIVPVAGAYCFTALGLLLLWPETNPSPGPYSDIRKLAGGLCLGAAVGCRAYCIFNIVILVAAWLSTLQYKHSRRENTYAAFYMGIPWLLCIYLLGAYNYARFDSIFETGVRYQVGYNDFHNDTFFTLWNFSGFFYNFYECFLKPFPWIARLQEQAPDWYQWPPAENAPYWNAAYGLWFNSPFSLWSVWFLFHLRKSKAWLGNAYPLCVALTVYTLASVLFILLYHYPYNRFAVDYSPWIMVLAVFGYMDAWQRCPKRWQPELLIAGALMAFYGVFTGIMSAFL